MIRDNRMTTTEPAGRSSGEIREDIRRTRSDLDSTVVAIEERLTPGQIIDEAWHFLRRRKEESTGPGTTSRIVRDHPIPMALVGAGLGLLAVEAIGGGSEPSRGRGGQRAREWDRPEGSDEGDGGVKEKMAGAKDRVSGMTHEAGEALGGMGQQARERAHDVRERAQELGETVGHKVQHGTRRARRGLAHQMEENPLAVGAAAFALGIAASSMFPSTRWEDETMGETRDTLVREARETGRETWDEAKEVASAATEAAKDEAERQGLTPEGVAESVDETARRAGEPGREAVRDRSEEKGPGGPGQPLRRPPPPRH